MSAHAVAALCLCAVVSLCIAGADARMLRGTDYKPYTAVGVTERPFPQFYATRRGMDPTILWRAAVWAGPATTPAAAGRGAAPRRAAAGGGAPQGVPLRSAPQGVALRRSPIERAFVPTPIGSANLGGSFEAIGMSLSDADSNDRWD